MNTDRLISDLSKMTQGAGKVLDVLPREGGFTAVFDTEFAALKVFYRYRYSEVHFGPSPNMGGYYVSVDRPSGRSKLALG